MVFRESYFGSNWIFKMLVFEDSVEKTLQSKARKESNDLGSASSLQQKANGEGPYGYLGMRQQ